MSNEINDVNTTSDSSLADDFLNNFFAPPVTLTREQEFVKHLVDGKLPRIANLLLYLKSEMGLYDRFSAYGLHYHSAKMLTPQRAPLTRVARVMVEHYLMSAYAHWFLAGQQPNKAPCDMGRVLDEIMKREDVSRIIFTENRT